MFKKLSRKSSRGSFDDIPLPTPQTSSANLSTSIVPPVPPTIPIETRLQQKTDLLDELRKTLPLDVRVPTIIAVGAKGSGKSSVLETLTGVPFPRGPNGMTRRVVKTHITADPTATSEFALVSEKEPSCRDGRRVTMQELGGVLTSMFAAKAAPARRYGDDDEEEVPATSEPEGPIFVRVVRPSGPSYQVVDLPALTEANESLIESVLAEDNKALLLPVLAVHDVFDNAAAVKLAKKVDPDGRRIIGVVTKIDQVEKDHQIVEKLQMTSRRDVALPLGYVAVRLTTDEELASGSITRQQLLETENQFFATNPLLKGLRSERWGAITLKKLVVEYQSNFISHRIPDLSKQVRQEIELVENEIQNTNATFNHPQHFFTKVVSDVGSMAFEFNDLVTGTRTRDDQSLNLGARFYSAVSSREAEARKRLPSCMSPTFAEYLKRELAQVPGMVSGSSDALSHPVFTKAIREHCGPVLRDYANGLIKDANMQLRDVVNALVDERFSEFPRLVEALRTDFEVLATGKVSEAESVISRLLEAELSWVFVSEADQAVLIKEVQALLSKKSTLKSADLWSEDGEEEPQIIRPVVLRTDSERDIENFQATLDVFIRFFTKRLFYTVPMNIRNVILAEFRKDMVEVVVSKYNEDNKLRTLMSVELWLDQLQSQRSDKKAALIEVLAKLDLLV